MLDQLGILYAVGGSVASSIFGEPRSTLDVDVAVRLEAAERDRLIDAFGVDFYVPRNQVDAAIANRSSFNLVHRGGWKVDLFVLGDRLLDELQLRRRVAVSVGSGTLWVTSPADQILRKLDWYRIGGGVSDRQWRDVVGLLMAAPDLDVDDLRRTAAEVGLAPHLERALDEAGRLGGS